MPVNFYQSQDGSQDLLDGITYLSFQSFESLERKTDQAEMKTMIVICDESDSILFGNDNNVNSATKMLP
jgi:hypothetical protein